ncbi:MAG TPA: aldolase/citrate lyase family protein [Burkholderiales bacterium]|jgi:2-keto-3-deoxy-L-rhamnonate aldolase RhmA|nr:aldolase/citrate lyase family protein [Burkholderiales bacterium]
MTISFRRRLQKGDVLIGALLQMPLPEVAEIFVTAGYDWLFVDLEHSPMDARNALDVLTAVDDRIACVVRVPWNDEAHIKKALDIGATGVIVPLVNNAADARLAVGRCKYPPMGVRSVGITRSQRFDLDFDGYMKRANDDIAVIVQIEHVEAIRNIEEILDTPGIDGVFVGPFDLSGSMGLPGQIDHPRVQEAIGSVIEACEKRAIARCIYAHTPVHARTYMAQGYRVIGLCTDYIMLARQAADYLRAARN